MTAEDLLKMKIIDDMVPEPLGGAHRDIPAIAKALSEIITGYLKELTGIDKDKLLALRYEKFRNIGVVA